jgi:FkbM family methyltransferase
MISYAQNAEDVVLKRIFADVKSGFYVDVGAWDPLADSVTKAFYDAGWHGINLEPHPERIQIFRKHRRRDRNLQVAASDITGTAILNVTTYGPLSTLEDSVIDPSNPDYTIVKRIEVRTLPLAVILDDYVGDRRIDFLKIDVEGHEEKVLRGAGLERHRPTVLVVEATCPTTNGPKWHAWQQIVLDAGYEFGLFDGLNRFYVRVDRTDLLPGISYGACCLDGYVTHRELQVRSQLLDALSRLEATS